MADLTVLTINLLKEFIMKINHFLSLIFLSSSALLCSVASAQPQTIITIEDKDLHPVSQAIDEYIRPSFLDGMEDCALIGKPITLDNGNNSQSYFVTVDGTCQEKNQAGELAAPIWIIDPQAHDEIPYLYEGGGHTLRISKKQHHGHYDLIVGIKTPTGISDEMTWWFDDETKTYVTLQ